MKFGTATTLVFLTLLGGSLSDSASARTKPAATEAAPAEADGKEAPQLSDKAAKKISTAIGEEVGDFVVTGQEDAEAPTGYKGVRYTVRTNGGKVFKCEIMEPSKLGRIATWGMGNGGDAVCTRFSGSDRGGARSGQTAGASNGGKAARSAPAAAGVPVDEKKPGAVSDKAAKKISKAIGEEIGDFTVTGQEQTEAPTGYTGTRYTVRTNSGKTYKCDIMEPSKLGRIATLGMGSGADAMCTDFTKGSRDQGKTNQAACNALLRAAHKCD